MLVKYGMFYSKLYCGLCISRRLIRFGWGQEVQVSRKKRKWLSEWILLYVTFCTIMAISRQKDVRSRDYQGFFIVHSTIDSTAHSMTSNIFEHCICTTSSIRPGWNPKPVSRATNGSSYPPRPVRKRSEAIHSLRQSVAGLEYLLLWPFFPLSGALSKWMFAARYDSTGAENRHVWTSATNVLANLQTTRSQTRGLKKKNPWWQKQSPDPGHIYIIFLIFIEGVYISAKMLFF